MNNLLVDQSACSAQDLDWYWRIARELALLPESAVTDSLDLYRRLIGRILPKTNITNWLEGDYYGQPVRIPLSRREGSVGHGGFNNIVKTREMIFGQVISVRESLFRAGEGINAEQNRELTLAGRRRLQDLPAHPNLAKYWGKAKRQDKECEVMSYVEGETLRLFAQKNGLSYGLFLDIATGLIDGLQFFHDQGLVHRDIKPENIILKKIINTAGQLSYIPQIIDPDLVIVNEQQRVLQLLRLKILLQGTPEYMPLELFCPEAVSDSYDLRAADVYALGRTLYRLLSPHRHRDISQNPWIRIGREALGEDGIADQEMVPPYIMNTLRRMAAPQWQQRLSLAEAAQIFAKLQATSTQKERNNLLVAPLEEPGEESESRTLGQRWIGDHCLVNPIFVQDYHLSTMGVVVSLAELARRNGEAEIGIPLSFANREQALAFYRERRTFVEKFNQARLQHIDLFPGVFDVVLEQVDNQDIVWIIRPKLTDAFPLAKANWRIWPATIRQLVLRDIARSLAVLESAGYWHSGISLERVFVVPPQIKFAGRDYSRTLMLEPNLEYYIPVATEEKSLPRVLPHKIEVMDTNMSQPIESGKIDPNIALFGQMAEILYPEGGGAQRYQNLTSWGQIVAVIAKQ